MEKQPIKTYLSPELAEKLTRMATAEGVSVSTLAGTLISKALSPTASPVVIEDNKEKDKEKLTRTYATVTYVRFLLEELAMATTDPSKALALLAKAKERSGAVSVKKEKEVPNG